MRTPVHPHAKLTVVCLALALCGAAQATTVTMKFGQLLSGEGAPESPDFATLVITEQGNDVRFELNASNLKQFSGSPFLRTLAVDLKDNVTSKGSISSVSGGVNFLDISSGGGPGGSWDMRFNFGKGQDRLTHGETSIWTWVGGAGKWSSFAAHVQGVDYGNTKSVWYSTQEDKPTVTPVPEPSTYGLFAAGLAALALVKRRRRQAAQ